MNAPKVLAFAGSLRADSFNKKLVKIAAQGARSAGAKVTYLDLRDYPLPVFDQDLETKDGPPGNARKLKELLKDHEGFLIAAPEYNSSITGALKNMIDWTSRPASGEAPLACFDGKSAALMSASPGALGGLRGLVHVRSILGNIGTLVLPDQVSIPAAHEAFNADGSLKDPKKQKAVEDLGKDLTDLLKKLAF